MHILHCNWLSFHSFGWSTESSEISVWLVLVWLALLFYVLIFETVTTSDGGMCGVGAAEFGNVHIRPVKYKTIPTNLSEEELFENAFQTRRIWKRRLFVGWMECVWCDFRVNLRLQIPPAKCPRGLFNVRSSSDWKIRFGNSSIFLFFSGTCSRVVKKARPLFSPRNWRDFGYECLFTGVLECLRRRLGVHV